jgi:hypothetical protein
LPVYAPSTAFVGSRSCPKSFLTPKASESPARFEVRFKVWTWITENLINVKLGHDLEERDPNHNGSLISTPKMPTHTQQRFEETLGME